MRATVSSTQEFVGMFGIVSRQSNVQVKMALQQKQEKEAP